MKESKKLIRQVLEEGINNTVLKFELTSTSKKTQKLIKEASKKISEQLKVDLKKKEKKEAKLSDAQKKVVKKSA
jgi:hypothetical protein